MGIFFSMCLCGFIDVYMKIRKLFVYYANKTFPNLRETYNMKLNI